MQQKLKLSFPTIIEVKPNVIVNPIIIEKIRKKIALNIFKSYP